MGRRAVGWSGKILSGSCTALALFTPRPPAGGNVVLGACSPVKTAPLIVLHTVLMPDGGVLMYGSTPSDDRRTAVSKLYWKQPTQTSFVIVPVTRLYAN